MTPRDVACNELVELLTEYLEDALPASDPRRAEFVRVLTKMAAKLATIQRADGFWNVDLGNPNDFGGPETSGTAFFTYGIAWGINHGVLPAADRIAPLEQPSREGLVHDGGMGGRGILMREGVTRSQRHVDRREEPGGDRRSLGHHRMRSGPIGRDPLDRSNGRVGDARGRGDCGHSAHA